MSNYKGQKPISPDGRYLIFNESDTKFCEETGDKGASTALIYNKYWVYDSQENTVRKGQEGVVTEDIYNFVTRRGRNSSKHIVLNQPYVVQIVHRDNYVTIDIAGYLARVPFPMIKEEEKMSDAEIIKTLNLEELPDIDIDKIQNASTFEELNTTEEDVLLTLVKTNIIARKYLQTIINLYSINNNVRVVKDETSNRLQYISGKTIKNVVANDIDLISPIDSSTSTATSTAFEIEPLNVPGRFKEFQKELQKEADKYFWSEVARPLAQDEIKNKQNTLSEVIKKYSVEYSSIPNEEE